ncbi:universal stress protein [Halorubrum gandharaense]
MTYFVPFDGSQLSQAALGRATDLAATDEAVEAETDDAPAVRAFAVIPRGNVDWARQRDLIPDYPDAEYGAERVADQLRSRAANVAPEASFETRFVGKREVSGRVVSAIRRRARAVDADVVVLGSENAGHVVTSITNVAPTVAADDAFDVFIVRRAGD